MTDLGPMDVRLLALKGAVGVPFMRSKFHN